MWTSVLLGCQQWVKHETVLIKGCKERSRQRDYKWSPYNRLFKWYLDSRDYNHLKRLIQGLKGCILSWSVCDKEKYIILWKVLTKRTWKENNRITIIQKVLDFCSKETDCDCQTSDKNCSFQRRTNPSALFSWKEALLKKKRQAKVRHQVLRKKESALKAWPVSS